MNIATRTLLALFAAALSSPAPAQDFVVVILDDVGVDRVECYGVNPDAGPTPTLDSLAAMGVKFAHCWASPSCRPTRAGLLTGQHSFRTGVGGGPGRLDPGEVIVPEMLTGHASAFVGKWHLDNVTNDPNHPNETGFPLYLGCLSNLFASGGTSYFDWPKWAQGNFLGSQFDYMTSNEFDDGLRVWNRFFSPAEPRCLFISSHSPHKPLHAPPPSLTTIPLSGNPEDTPVDHYRAALEALDTELARFMDAVDLSTTTVFLIGDNGTFRDAVTPPQDPDRSKKTVYQNGVRVPLIVIGQAVSSAACGATVDELVSVWDMAATLVDLAGLPPAATAVDSFSFAPLLADPYAGPVREFLYTERFKPSAKPYTKFIRAARDARYKIVQDSIAHVEEFFDLAVDPLELVDLLSTPPLSPDEQAAFDAIAAFMATMQ